MHKYEVGTLNQSLFIKVSSMPCFTISKHSTKPGSPIELTAMSENEKLYLYFLMVPLKLIVIQGARYLWLPLVHIVKIIDAPVTSTGRQNTLPPNLEKCKRQCIVQNVKLDIVSSNLLNSWHCS